jgi:hypothetical protein
VGLVLIGIGSLLNEVTFSFLYRFVFLPLFIICFRSRDQKKTKESNEPIDQQNLKSDFISIKPSGGILIQHITDDGGYNADHGDKTPSHLPFGDNPK